MMEKPALELNHIFKEGFDLVALAYWMKYKKPNLWNRVNIIDVKTIDDGKFMVTRRHDTFANDHYIFEHVTFDRENREIETYMRSDKKERILDSFVEHCKYKEILPDVREVED